MITTSQNNQSISWRLQEKLDIVEEKDFRREELLEKYTVKMLYG